MTLWPVMISGLALGAAGSLHCVGMCGPLSLALPVHHLSPGRKVFSLLLYQLGRIMTYSILGLAVGLVGRRIDITGYQQWFSIIMGGLILVFAVLYLLRRQAIHIKLFNNFYLFIQRQMSSLLRSSMGPLSFLLMGMANGLLPCGMIYIALLNTMSMTSLGESISFMAMFGAGTLPAMMLIAYAGLSLTPHWRMKLKGLVPVVIASVGVILILRGLNLGIPFISPAFPVVPGEAVKCHP
jgi:sulfite exporter TauE/SafE